MGAWGPGIFSDDTACDARDEWTDLIAEGRTAQEATAKIGADVAGLEDEPVAWLGMAATAWKLGRLEIELRDRALQIIDDERPDGPLEPWYEAGRTDLRQRKAALARLRVQLLSPQPAPRKLDCRGHGPGACAGRDGDDARDRGAPVAGPHRRPAARAAHDLPTAATT